METGKPTEVGKPVQQNEQAFFNKCADKLIIVDFLDGSSEQAQLGCVNKYTLIVLEPATKQPQLIYKQAIKRIRFIP